MNAVEFYVATNGNDSWSGRFPAPNPEGTDGPFATLLRAREAVRDCKGQGDQAQAVNVYVREGKYFLTKSLVLGPEDSGTRAHPVTYKAYPGEKPILSGGRKVAGWQRHEGEILKAELSGAKGGKWKFRRLFFNGQVQIRARFPNFDPENPLYGGWAFTEDAAEPGSEVAFKVRPGTFPRRWAKPSEAEVFIFAGLGWANDVIAIKEYDEATGVIELVHPTKDHDRPWNYESNPFRPGNRFYVENLLEELDQPGEWCLDSEEGLLYFWPPAPIEGGEIVVPYLDCLIALRGAAWITISGFTLTETTDGDNFLHDGGEGYGPMTPIAGWRYCGDAIHVRDSAYCCIEDNTIYAVGGNGIYLEEYNLRHTIRHNEIAYAGACGIVLLGSKRRHPSPEELSRWTGRNRHQSHKQPHPQFNQVTDNHIHHCGAINKYVAAIFMGVSDGNLIAHNLIENMPHHGINLGTNSYGRNILEYNIVRHVALETHDTGAINSWMEDEYDTERVGHIIRYNRIDDVRGCHFDEKGALRDDALTFGIYLDNYTSNCFVYGNIVTRATGTGITVHCGKNNIFENNIIVGGTWQIRYQYHYYVMPGYLTGNRFTRNILLSEDPKTHLYCLHRWSDYVLAESDYNVFFNTSNGEYTIMELLNPPTQRRVFPLAEWKEEMGYDQHSLVADPLFVNLAQGDFQLQPESPALKVGFVPIDSRKFGVRPRNEQ